MIKINDIKLPISYTQEYLKNKLEKLLKNKIKEIKILKKSIDARNKNNIFYVVSVGVELQNKNNENKLKYEKFDYKIEGIKFDKCKLSANPIVVGFGPSGMFFALCLAKMGLNPIVIEQGEDVNNRQKSVQNFWQNGKLNKFSNVQFGEGGAGTFSDGKLNTNVNNKYCKMAIEELYLHGAPEQILYEGKPHIGTDKLRDVVTNIRKHIISLGGTILFNTKLVDIITIDNNLKSIVVKNVITNKTQIFSTSLLALCIGHSARDTFLLLKNRNFDLMQKPFAMGVRIEQKAYNINKMQYGDKYDKNLGNADYKLATHLNNGRTVFTFCMCPGGYVVASSSDEGEVVTNGMSNFARDNEYSNSALLVNVLPSDFESNDVLAGMYFQQKYERLAFELGGKNYNAPVESVGSFLYDKSNIGKCSYKPGYTFTKLKNCLPEFVYDSLKMGIENFNSKYKIFAQDDDILIGVETRSSSPITIVRDENFCSNIKGVYPCGEGAGYAGGIISSAQDAIKICTNIYKTIKGENV